MCDNTRFVRARNRASKTSILSSVFGILSSSRRLSCKSDGRTVPAANPAHPHVSAAGAIDHIQSTPELRNRGPVSLCLSTLGTGWRWVAQMSPRIEESWVGDLLALICLAATIYLFLVIGWVLS